jgi:hypothetical protein
MAGFMLQAAMLFKIGSQQMKPEGSTGGMKDASAEHAFESILRKMQKEIALVGLPQCLAQISVNDGESLHGESFLENAAPPPPKYAVELLPGDSIATKLPLAPEGEPAAQMPQGNFLNRQVGVAVLDEIGGDLAGLPRPESAPTSMGPAAPNPEAEKSGNPLHLFPVFDADNAEVALAPLNRPDTLFAAAGPSPGSGFTDGASQNHAGAENALVAAPGPAGGEQQSPAPLAIQPSMRTVDADLLAEQIVQRVRLAQNGEATELHVSLKPEFLGKLSIKVASDMHGIRMEIKAENEMVRQIMQDSLPDLQQRLADKGIMLNHLALFADSGSTSRQKTERGLHTAARLRGSEQAVETAPEPRRPARLTLIDYFA